MSRKTGATLRTLYVQPETSNFEDKVAHWLWTCKGILKFGNVLTILGLVLGQLSPYATRCSVMKLEASPVSEWCRSKASSILKMADYSMNISPESPSAVC
jgi:hypothetical protein